MTKFGTESSAALDEIYTSFNDDEDKLDLILAEKPGVLSFHFGIPTPDRVRALKTTGSVLMANVTKPAEARQAQNAGMDIVIAQGFEAGGHRDTLDPSTDKTSAPWR